MSTASSLPPPGAAEQAYICALVVTFNPDPQRLQQVVDAIAPQVGAVLVVDNGSTQPCDGYLRPPATPVYYLPLGDNHGIAAAQNIGLAWCQTQGHSHALLLDQDALAPPGMAQALLHEERVRASRGEKVAGVGPLIHDPRRGRDAPFFRIAPPTMLWVTSADAGEDAARVDLLIAAGHLLPLKAYEALGPLRESLFIDYVDLEWSLRARHEGWRLYGHYGTRLDHRLGEEPARALGRQFMSHSPLRHYYMARNALALWRMPHVPLTWIMFDAVVLAARLLIFGVLARSAGGTRSEHLRMMLRGIWDGTRGRGGRIDQAARDWRVPEEVSRIVPRRL